MAEVIICPVCGAKMVETKDNWENPDKIVYICSNCGQFAVRQLDLK